MTNKWRFSIIILIYKGKEDIQNYNNYRGLKLLNHALKS